MATATEIADLRLLVAEPDETTYTDVLLDERIDESASMDHAALRIWEEKAASWASLVNISEGGSNRGMGSLHTNALAMIKHFQAKIAAAEAVSPTTTGPSVFIGRLTR